ncbi:GNAT family N-acetyltransferase [Rugamonas apoptosis]|uniref:GNAT family N-acetyltransferase n=1 Tax=Rugamonas apoptosis TaxID=2758570 RepID=A0A7W2FAF8_9BURK|nr:GNAT family N-acetyltransferase [Rugamonas apoptosis]MBA5687984.1 GNAT family N-acetyltransferase [Rugamonas apoptosis]
MSYHAELLSTIDALDAIKDQWQALCAALPENTGFFSSYSYLRSYLDFHQPNGWVVVAIYGADRAQLLGVFPLSIFNVQDGDNNYRACKPIGTPYAPYYDFAVRSQCRREVLSILIHNVLRGHFKCDLAFLGPLHDSSPLSIVLLEELDAPMIKMVSNRDALSQIDTRGQTLEAYFRRRKSLTLPNARYQERRLRKCGNVEICLTEHGADLANVVMELCQRNEEHFPEENYYRQHADWKTYMTQLATQLAPQGFAEIATLRLDQQVIASALSFLQPGRRYFYLIAYDPAFGRHSPSKILMAHLIERTFAEKNVFCFGAGQYQYKLDWCQSLGDIRTPVIFYTPEARRALDEKIVAGKMSAFISHH